MRDASRDSADRSERAQLRVELRAANQERLRDASLRAARRPDNRHRLLRQQDRPRPDDRHRLRSQNRSRSRSRSQSRSRSRARARRRRSRSFLRTRRRKFLESRLGSHDTAGRGQGGIADRAHGRRGLGIYQQTGRAGSASAASRERLLPRNHTHASAGGARCLARRRCGQGLLLLLLLYLRQLLLLQSPLLLELPVHTIIAGTLGRMHGTDASDGRAAYSCCCSRRCWCSCRSCSCCSCC